MRWLWVAALVGCGRLHFDALGDATAADAGDAQADAALVTLSQQAYIKASNTNSGDELSYSLALSGDGAVLALGAPQEASAAMGIDGNQADNTFGGAGAVYVFERAGAVWSQHAYVKATNTGAADLFGFRVALSADGNTLAVGAPGEASAAPGIDGNQGDNSLMGAGAVYVFARSGDTWSQQAYVKASNPTLDANFGLRVELSADGSTMAVTAPGVASMAGAVYVFTRNGVAWSEQQTFAGSNTEANDVFGLGVALSADGNTLAVGAPDEASATTGIDGNQTDNTATDAGAAYVFTRVVGVWSQQAYIKASNTDANDLFGYALSLSADGSRLASGAPREASAATGIDGNQADNSGAQAGAIYLFDRSGTVWTQQAYLKASNTDSGDWLGYAVHVSGDGATLAGGAPFEASSARGLDGDQADNSLVHPGAAYLWSRVGTTWHELHYVKASNTDPGDEFGGSVRLSSDAGTLVVGSFESSAATGVDGNQADNSAFDAGAAYVFR